MPILLAAGPEAGAGVAAGPWARAREEMGILNPRLRARMLFFDITRIAFRAPSDSHAQVFFPAAVLLQRRPASGRHRFLTAWGVLSSPRACWLLRRCRPVWQQGPPDSEHCTRPPRAW